MKRKAYQTALKKSPNNLKTRDNSNVNTQISNTRITDTRISPTPDYSFKSWNVNNVQNWLINIGLEDYATFFQSNKINGSRLSKITSDFLDSIGMLHVDKTVFYIELQKLYGKSVKRQLAQSVKTKKVVTITDQTHVVLRENGTLVVKAGPEIKKIEILRSNGLEEVGFERERQTFVGDRNIGDTDSRHLETPNLDKTYLMNKYFEESRGNTARSCNDCAKRVKYGEESAGKTIWNGVKNATINAFHETSREFMQNEIPDNPGPAKTRNSNKFRVENISPACEFPIIHGLW